MKILDLAAGENPYFLRFKIDFSPKDEYYYFDSDFKRLKVAKEKIERQDTKPKESHFIVGDSISLPFEDNYFDLIVISNFLSAPIHWNWDEDKEEVKIMYEERVKIRKILNTPEPHDYFYNERAKTVSEALRVLKPSGKIQVYTDLIVFAPRSYQRVMEELKSGFKSAELKEEEQRINELNEVKLKTKHPDFCQHFHADVLPNAEVWEFTK